MPERDRDNLVEHFRQRLITRRLIAVIGVLSAAVLFLVLRRWWV